MKESGILGKRGDEGNDSYTTGNYEKTNDEGNADDDDSFHENSNEYSNDQDDQEASMEQYRHRKKSKASKVTTAKLSPKGKGGTSQSKKVKKKSAKTRNKRKVD